MVKYSLPPLRDYQWPVLTSDARDDVTVSAPQLGKTVALGVWTLIGAWRDAESKITLPTWWTSPTYLMATQGMEKLAELGRSTNMVLTTRQAPNPRIILRNGGIIEARSWDIPENLYGPTVGRIACDEFGYLTTEAYTVLRSRVAETRVHGAGFMRFTGNVGEVGGEAENIFRHAMSGAPGWACRTWTWKDRALAGPCACDNGEPLPVSLEREEVERHGPNCERGLYLLQLMDVKARMSDLHFRQLYGAEWLDWSSLPAYTFDRAVHVTGDVKEQESLDIDLSCDFNVDPMVWIIGQHTATEAWDMDEIVLPGGATTQAACLEFLRRYPGSWTRGLNVYGDASGNARGTKSPESDYSIIRRVIGEKWAQLRFNVPPKNPPVMMRLNSVNAMLKNAEGKVRYYVHPRCAKLATDWARVALKPGTRDIDKSNKSLTHASDAAGYRLVMLFPVQSEGGPLYAAASTADSSFDGGVATMGF